MDKPDGEPRHFRFDAAAPYDWSKLHGAAFVWPAPPREPATYRRGEALPALRHARSLRGKSRWNPGAWLDGIRTHALRRKRRRADHGQRSLSIRWDDPAQTITFRGRLIREQ